MDYVEKKLEEIFQETQKLWDNVRELQRTVCALQRDNDDIGLESRMDRHDARLEDLEANLRYVFRNTEEIIDRLKKVEGDKK